MTAKFPSSFNRPCMTSMLDIVGLLLTEGCVPNVAKMVPSPSGEQLVWACRGLSQCYLWKSCIPGKRAVLGMPGCSVTLILFLLMWIVLDPQHHLG